MKTEKGMATKLVPDDFTRTEESAHQAEERNNLCDICAARDIDVPAAYVSTEEVEGIRTAGELENTRFHHPRSVRLCVDCYLFIVQCHASEQGREGALNGNMIDPGDTCPICGEGRIYKVDCPAEQNLWPDAAAYCDQCKATATANTR